MFRRRELAILEASPALWEAFIGTRDEDALCRHTWRLKVSTGWKKTVFMK